MNEQLKKTLIEILNRNHDDKQHILSDCHCDDGIICHEIQLSEIIENIPTHDYISHGIRGILTGKEKTKKKIN